VLATLGWGDRGVGEQVPAPQAELRIVDKNPKNWIFITFNVFEHLMELDKDGTLVPRLATKWHWLDDRTLEVTLRQGREGPEQPGKHFWDVQHAESGQPVA